MGVQQRLRSSDGITAAFDWGQITFRLVVDLNDLEDPEDDVLISSEVLLQAGPHRLPAFAARKPPVSRAD